MEHQAKQQEEKLKEVETLTAMFGEVLNRDAHNTLVEDSKDSNGDVNADAVMHIIRQTGKLKKQNSCNDTSVDTFLNNEKRISSAVLSQNSQQDEFVQNTFSSNQAPETSYAFTAAAKSTGAVPKILSKPEKSISQPSSCLTKELRKIVNNHELGNRTLILMRGLPGSGKTFLARKVVDACIGTDPLMNYDDHIFSTDDFFTNNRGVYQYDKTKLTQAHSWNQHRADMQLMRGVSPVIIDNTNIEQWEMLPYVKAGVSNGYIIEILTPKTPWAMNTKLLAKNNLHSVPIFNIKKMQNKFSPMTGNDLLSSIKITCPTEMVPPVKRVIPPMDESSISPETKVEKTVSVESNSSQWGNQSPVEQIPFLDHHDNNMDGDKQIYSEFDSINSDNPEIWEETPESSHNDDLDQQCQQVKQPLEKFLKIEDGWELCANWDESENKMSVKDINSSETNPKPLRESEKFNLKPDFRILTVKPEFYVPSKNKLPQTPMFDQSTKHNECEFPGAFRCKNKDFATFRNLFKTLSRADLRDIFDKCCGDVNWATEIILERVPSNQLVPAENMTYSVTEESCVESCSCLTAYNNKPDADGDDTGTAKKETIRKKTTNVKINRKKKKPKTPENECTLQLKREIELSIKMNEYHYSESLLSERRKRYGEIQYQTYGRDLEYGTAQALPLYEEPIVAIGSKFGPILGERKPSRMNLNEIDSKAQAMSLYVETERKTSPKPIVGSPELVALLRGEPEYEPYRYSDHDFCGFEENESMVNLHLDWELIRQLEKTSGCEGVSYPKHVKQIISVPITLLHEINAYWIESVMTQIENHAKLNYKLLKEDEDFVKRIEQKELGLESLGIEPRIPDFMEIMHLDTAFHATSDNIAARMTRHNLFNTFPELSQDILTEILTAHHNNFKATVETVLDSTGRHDLLKDESGLNKFLLTKIRERQQKVLKEQEKALTEAEWPVLPPDETVDMSSVEKYRNLAKQHLEMRKLCYEKALNYIYREMTTVATHYRELAHFHTKQYEKQASLAAASLVKLHAVRLPNSATIDLHFQRVAEATAALDLFLDRHINRLKEFQARNKGPRMQKVFLITGREADSEAGRARVKPAVKHRLKERGLVVSECNPGLLTARVTADDKLSYQVTPE